MAGLRQISRRTIYQTYISLLKKETISAEASDNLIRGQYHANQQPLLSNRQSLQNYSTLSMCHLTLPTALHSDQLDNILTMPSTLSGQTYQQVRYKARGKKQVAKSKKPKEEVINRIDSNEYEESDDEEDEDDIFRRHFKEDANFPNNYKDVRIHVKSLRLDGVIGSALNVARSKLDDLFLGSKLRRNGQHVLKKSTPVGEGDYADVISGIVEDQMKVKRVRIVKIQEGFGTNKVFIRIWKDGLVDKY